jgi:hypothetical protein
MPRSNPAITPLRFHAEKVVPEYSGCMILGQIAKVRDRGPICAAVGFAVIGSLALGAFAFRGCVSGSQPCCDQTT